MCGIEAEAAVSVLLVVTVVLDSLAESPGKSLALGAARARPGVI